MNNKEDIGQEFYKFVIDTLVNTAAQHPFPFDLLLKGCPAEQNKFLYLLNDFAKKQNTVLRIQRINLNDDIADLKARIKNTNDTLQALLSGDTVQLQASLVKEAEENKKLLVSALEESQRNIVHMGNLLTGISNGKEILKELFIVKDIVATLGNHFENDLIALKFSHHQYQKQLDALIIPMELSEEKLATTIEGKIEYFKDLLTVMEGNQVILNTRLLKVEKDIETIEKVIIATDQTIA